MNERFILEPTYLILIFYFKSLGKTVKGGKALNYNSLVMQNNIRFPHQVGTYVDRAETIVF